MNIDLSTFPASGFQLPLARGDVLTAPGRPLIMGIVNCTPDSFYAESRSRTTESAVDAAERMVDEGADIVDIGGESSRPGSEYVDAHEEIRRVVPVVEEIRRISDIPISIDTRKAEVARSALDAGADMINDISALRDDSDLAPLVARRRCPVVLMHMRGTPATMQEDPSYTDPVSEIIRELLVFSSMAQKEGIPKDRIVLDPGIGFGKRIQDNLKILAALDAFAATGYPILIGLSRKSFLGTLTGRKTGERLAGTLAAGLLSAFSGAAILRVHDVAETLDALTVTAAIMRFSREVTE